MTYGTDVRLGFGFFTFCLEKKYSWNTFLIIISLIIDDCLCAKPAAWYFICVITFLSSEHIKQVTYLHLQMKILEQKPETLSDFP